MKLLSYVGGDGGLTVYSLGGGEVAVGNGETCVLREGASR